MSAPHPTNEPDLRAFLIAPDRELAAEFRAGLETTGSFQIVSELTEYPPSQTLELHLRQTQPDAVIVDVGTNVDAAAEVIRFVANHAQPAHVVGLHHANDPVLILKTLRQGASEFLHAPFDPPTVRAAVAHLRRMRPPERAERAPGVIACFSSAKPGCGASIIAVQTAFALQRTSGQRILLADFDLLTGTVGFYLKLRHPASIIDALAGADQLTPALWSTWVVSSNGVEVLLAPEAPYVGPIDSARLHAVLEYARLTYDWVVIDLPVVFEKMSLLSLPVAGRAFLVSTPELPSLFLTRKAILSLERLGLAKDRFQLLVNRFNKRAELSEIETLVNCVVTSKIPNDFFALSRAITLAEPLDAASELGKAIEALALGLSGKTGEPRPKPAVAHSRPVLAPVLM